MFGETALATCDSGLVVINASNLMARNTALIIGVKGSVARDATS